jgi:hypothetical protein
MHASAIALGILLFAGVLLDAFQTIILPRRPVGRLRITRLFFLATWGPWSALTRLVPARKREQSYSVYGPLSLLLLFGLWAGLLVSAFALVYFGLGTPFHDPAGFPGRHQALRTSFYASGSSLFTLGLGDVFPATHAARFLVVLEAGTGLGFIALVIGYLPVLYSAFSTREVSVALLDARAGSPPTAAELLSRHAFDGGHHALTGLLAEWERWSATMLETHISYPILCYYRSQHDNQSWLAALVAILDTCALIITTIEGPSARQAQLTFAVGRHVLVDLGHVFNREKIEAALRIAPLTRLDDTQYARLCEALRAPGFALCGDRNSRTRLEEIRRLYEPHALAMAQYLRLELPAWMPPALDPSKKPALWNTVANLRSPTAARDRLSTHLSPQSTAGHLDSED